MVLYILFVPDFVIVSHIIFGYSSKKRFFSYYGIFYAIVSIYLLGFIVWAYHLFTVVINVNIFIYFTVAIMAIAVLTRVKIFSWLARLYGFKNTELSGALL